MNIDKLSIIAPDREKHREALAAISSRMTERHVDWQTSLWPNICEAQIAEYRLNTRETAAT